MESHKVFAQAGLKPWSPDLSLQVAGIEVCATGAHLKDTDLRPKTARENIGKTLEDNYIDSFFCCFFK
jgi:hypothetical protein